MQFKESLKEAVRTLKIADHMAYVTFPLVREQRLLLKIFDEIYKSIINTITAVLEYEYITNKIKIYKDKDENLKNFIDKYARNYNINSDEINKIKEIIDIHYYHIKSSMEFVKNEKIVIMSDNLDLQILNIEKIKEYLVVAKEILRKVNEKTTNK
jgi:hypothetical protein